MQVFNKSYAGGTYNYANVAFRNTLLSFACLELLNVFGRPFRVITHCKSATAFLFLALVDCCQFCMGNFLCDVVITEYLYVLNTNTKITTFFTCFCFVFYIILFCTSLAHDVVLYFK